MVVYKVPPSPTTANSHTHYIPINVYSTHFCIYIFISIMSMPVPLVTLLPGYFHRQYFSNRQCWSIDNVKDVSIWIGWVIKWIEQSYNFNHLFMKTIFGCCRYTNEILLKLHTWALRLKLLIIWYHVDKYYALKTVNILNYFLRINNII